MGSDNNVFLKMISFILDRSKCNVGGPDGHIVIFCFHEVVGSSGRSSGVFESEGSLL